VTFISGQDLSREGWEERRGGEKRPGDIDSTCKNLAEGECGRFGPKNVENLAKKRGREKKSGTKRAWGKGNSLGGGEGKKRQKEKKLGGVPPTVWQGEVCGEKSQKGTKGRKGGSLR